jgi:hypothetical protein
LPIIELSSLKFRSFIVRAAVTTVGGVTDGHGGTVAVKHLFTTEAQFFLKRQVPIPFLMDQRHAVQFVSETPSLQKF